MNVRARPSHEAPASGVPGLATPLFDGFWIGGFEGADHVNGHGRPLDPNRHNGHRQRADEDYAALRRLGIRTVRETIGWRLSHPGERQHDAAIVAQAQLAARHGLRVIWTLMHYGWPPGIDPFVRPEEFIDAFARHCRRVAGLLRGIDGPPAVYQPINEISFLAWAASSTGLIHPHVPRGPEAGDRLKRVLVRAALRGTDAIWREAPSARIVHTDPLVSVVPPRGAGPAATLAAEAAHDSQFHAWDMLCGRTAPELGGALHYLDVVGVNYYHDNQWEAHSGARLHWHLDDPRRRPFEDLIADLDRRYGRPICLTETGHVGQGRGEWLDHIVGGVIASQARGVSIGGLCLYPVIDRPDWQNATHWHHAGLWDVPGAAHGDFTRQLCRPYAARLQFWQHALRDTAAALPAARAASSASASAPSPASPSHLSTSADLSMNPLIVFSHLRWDFVYQRPQQVLSRLAAERDVFFVEEPMPGAASARLETYAPCSGVVVLRMHLPGTAAGFGDEHMAGVLALLRAYLAAHEIDDYLLWFYTPMAYPLAQGLSPRGMVYDCMDELAAFDFAPRALIERETALLGEADLVFAGGHSLYEAKRRRHPDVHCFPSSVDHAHFGQAGVPDHPDQQALPRPRLGYYGVIDERLDLALIAALAEARPEWQIVMVGPLAKIDPAGLPRRANLHWMGQRRYDELPAFLSGWDICLMPFALNDATRLISPTKTLEYLAAGKPVVTTPIPDVAHQHPDLLAVARTPEDFVAACEAILGRDATQKAAFGASARAAVSQTSWERTAAAMALLLRRLDVAPALPVAPPMQPAADSGVELVAAP